MTRGRHEVHGARGKILQGILLEDKTVGILGTGLIGKKTCEKLSGTVKRICCFDGYPGFPTQTRGSRLSETFVLYFLSLRLDPRDSECRLRVVGRALRSVRRDFYSRPFDRGNPSPHQQSLDREDEAKGDPREHVARRNCSLGRPLGRTSFRSHRRRGARRLWGREGSHVQRHEAPRLWQSSGQRAGRHAQRHPFVSRGILYRRVRSTNYKEDAGKLQRLFGCRRLGPVGLCGIIQTIRTSEVKLWTGLSFE